LGVLNTTGCFNFTDSGSNPYFFWGAEHYRNFIKGHIFKGVYTGGKKAPQLVGERDIPERGF